MNPAKLFINMFTETPMMMLIKKGANWNGSRIKISEWKVYQRFGSISGMDHCNRQPCQKNPHLSITATSLKSILFLNLATFPVWI